MTQYPAVVLSIEKDKIVLECSRGPTLQGVFTKGKLPKVGNKGVAVIDERTKEVKFRGPKGAAYVRLISGSAE